MPSFLTQMLLRPSHIYSPGVVGENYTDCGEGRKK